MTKQNYEIRVTCKNCGEPVQHETLTGMLRVADAVIVDFKPHDCKPQPKTREMVYSELRELVVNGMWFKAAKCDGRWCKLDMISDPAQTLNGIAVCVMLQLYSHYSLNACESDMKPLTVTE